MYFWRGGYEVGYTVETTLIYFEQQYPSIDACIRLHNFIVDFREENKKQTPLEELEKVLFDKDCILFLSLNPEIDNFGVRGSDNGIQFVGRPTKRESESHKAGGEIRNQITSEVRESKYV